MTLNVTKDVNNHPIQAVEPVSASVAKASISGSSVQLTIPTGSVLIRCASNNNCYIEFGTNPTATTNSMLFPAGVEIFRVPAGATKIAVIQDGAVTGTFQVTKMV